MPELELRARLRPGAAQGFVEVPSERAWTLDTANFQETFNRIENTNMATAAIGNYVFEPKDKVENFHGAQVLYIGWEDHLMFCAPLALPLPPTTLFNAILEQILPGIYGPHPDFAKIDWSKVEWFKSSKPWRPDYQKSIADNGLKHKDTLRFRSPGLTGIKGSCS